MWEMDIRTQDSCKRREELYILKVLNKVVNMQISPEWFDLFLFLRQNVPSVSLCFVLLAGGGEESI